MEILIIIGSILVILGLIGSIVPAIPGPLFSFIGLVLLFISKGAEAVSIGMLVFFGISMLMLTALNYLIPILGARLSGASKKGQWGSVIGALLGIVFFPPLGIFIGALIGAVVGEMHSGKKLNEAMRAGLGVIAGSVMAIILQVVYSLGVTIYFFVKLF